MKVLFIGASGTVGRCVVPLLAQEFEMLLVGRHVDEVEGVPVQSLDICDFEMTLALLQQSRADAIVNCAIADYRASHSTDDATERQHRYLESAIDVNVRGAYHLYEAAARAGIPKFVFISSLTAVTGLPRYEGIIGDEMPRPRDLYACTKLFGEQLGQVYATQHSISVSCLRLGQPYPTSILSNILRDDWARSLLVHTDDIALAIAAALRSVEPFAVYPIVSSSESRWVSESATQGLEYAARYFFSPAGATQPEQP